MKPKPNTAGNAPQVKDTERQAEATDTGTATGVETAPQPSDASCPLLHVADLDVSLSGTLIVHGVGFDLQQGQLACILGPNGCGKTTTLRALLGLIPHQRGEVVVDGRPTDSLSERQRAKLFAYVPQVRELPFWYSVKEVVQLGRTPYLGPLSQLNAHDHQIVHRAMERMGLLQLQNRPLGRLSGGQQQLAFIARALAQQPRVLVMDEPCASLDFGNQQLVLGQIRSLAREGMGVLMVTHDPNHALGYAQKVVVMQAGRVVAAGQPDQVLSDQLFWQLYHQQLHVTQVTWQGQTKTVCVPW